MIKPMMPTESATQIDPLALQALRLALPERVFIPGDEGYDAARAGFGVAVQPSPDVVVVARTSDEVVTAVNFARAQQLPIGVRATGHNFGFAYQHGLMINTEQMSGVSIDPVQRTARVEAGVRWGAVVAAAAAHGLAPLNGSSPTVGVVGYTLFGGFGWLLRKYGAAVDSVIAAELVTADGQMRRVSESSDPDLFWALRGASGNFGVVTALEFKLYPVRQIYGGALFFPMEHAREILTAYSRWAESVPDELTSSIVMLRVPPVPSIPEFLRGKAIVTIRAAYVGAEADGVALLDPLRSLPGLIADTFAMMPYTESRTIASDPVDPMPVHRATTMLSDLSPATIDTLVRVNGVDSSTPVMVLEIRHLGGAMTRVAPESTSFSQRYAPFLTQMLSVTMGPEHAEVVRHNTRTIFDALQPHATGGVFPSWLGDGDYGVDRMRAGFSAEHYERLTDLKGRYDRDNMFRLNHNIPPRA